MITLDVITATPGFFDSPFETSILKRAQTKGKIQLRVFNVRDFAEGKHKQIDDKAFGGGAGMVLKPEPFFKCIEHLQKERDYDHIIFTTPGGKIFTQSDANKFSLAKNILFICGHYKGIDDRVREKFATDEISVGNVVLTGGEIPVLLIVDAIARLVPGVLNDSESALDDSFQDDEKIAAPVYTRPAEYNNMSVPAVLLTGNHGDVKNWKNAQSVLLTEKWKKLNNIGEKNGQC